MTPAEEKTAGEAPPPPTSAPADVTVDDDAGGRAQSLGDPAAVETHELSKLYRRGRVEKLAVDRVSLRVERGSIFGLIGPNGAGKSTLLSMIATLTGPTGGGVSVLGHDVTREPKTVRHLLSLNAASGERGFYWRLNATQNLAFFAALQGLGARASRASVAVALERVGLTSDSRLRFGEFSSGMRRRLNIARALLVDRPVYLFDEPTTNIDPASAAMIRGILRDLERAGKTVILVTHNMEEATELCHEVGLLYAGRLIRKDPPDVLRRHVPSGEIEVEVGDPVRIDEVADSLRALPAVTGVERREDGRLRVRTPEPDRDIAGLLWWASQCGIRITGMSVVRPQLSDAFIHLIEEATGDRVEALDFDRYPRARIRWGFGGHGLGGHGMHR